MRIPFASSKNLTLGAELELQLLGSRSHHLQSSSLDVLQAFPGRSDIKAEIFQSMLEITSNVCENAIELGHQLRAVVLELRPVCEKLNLSLASAGLHPIATHLDSELFPHERYVRLVQERRWLAHRLLIFGFHVHVGVRNGEHAMQMINGVTPYLPLLLSLSASSPFYNGEVTKLASCRSTFFEANPSGGHGCPISTWEDFEKMHSTLVRAGSIESTRDLWWDIRPSPTLGTIEIRICDSPATISEAVAITALIHLICKKIDHEISTGKNARPLIPSWILRENKWRAAKDGALAEFIIDEAGQTMPVKEFLWRLIDEVSPLVNEYGYSPQMNLLKTLVLLGPSSERQRQVFAAFDGDLRSVVRHLIHEFLIDRPSWTYESLNKTSA